MKLGLHLGCFDYNFFYFFFFFNYTLLPSLGHSNQKNELFLANFYMSFIRGKGVTDI